MRHTLRIETTTQSICDALFIRTLSTFLFEETNEWKIYSKDGLVDALKHTNRAPGGNVIKLGSFILNLHYIYAVLTWALEMRCSLLWIWVEMSESLLPYKKKSPQRRYQTKKEKEKESVNLRQKYTYASEGSLRRVTVFYFWLCFIKKYTYKTVDSYWKKKIMTIICKFLRLIMWQL